MVKYFTDPNPSSLEPPDLSVVLPFVQAALPPAYAIFGVQLFHVSRLARDGAFTITSVWSNAFIRTAIFSIRLMGAGTIRGHVQLAESESLIAVRMLALGSNAVVSVVRAVCLI